MADGARLPRIVTASRAVQPGDDVSARLRAIHLRVKALEQKAETAGGSEAVAKPAAKAKPAPKENPGPMTALERDLTERLRKITQKFETLHADQAAQISALQDSVRALMDHSSIAAWAQPDDVAMALLADMCAGAGVAASAVVGRGRTAVLTQLRRDYVAACRAKGISLRRIAQVLGGRSEQAVGMMINRNGGAS